MIYALLAFIGLSIILGIKCMIEAGGRDAVELELLQTKKRLKDRAVDYRNMVDSYHAEVKELQERDDWFAQVLAFHQKFNAPIEPFPRLVSLEEEALRTRLLNEEVGELKDAVTHGDLVEIADGLADVIYIALGTSIAYGIDLRPVFAEVHDSNMRKVPWNFRLAALLEASGKKIPMGKILKPIGWVGPQIAPILREQKSLLPHIIASGKKIYVTGATDKDIEDKVVIE